MAPDPAPDRRATLRAWADRLACPVCRARLCVEDQRIVCSACGRVYPVVDGIAALIAEREDGGV